MENLEFHDRFLLSQTCTALRHITFRNWSVEINHLSPEQEHVFWAGLAYASPRHWACPKCRKLHRIDKSDTPTMHASRQQLLPCKADLSRGITLGPGYSIQHHHIQFALKLSRLGNAHQEYLDPRHPRARSNCNLASPQSESEQHCPEKRFILPMTLFQMREVANPLPQMRRCGQTEKLLSWKSGRVAPVKLRKFHSSCRMNRLSMILGSAL
ncbi:hypothetical protein Trco_008007 [Trichoderma cornu-damae]|uniref:Uncharacterized protein n=1 Tax=Trichoderma cornu-damae TaxID=654480 RepID=A0A9P8TSR9_9HYPO|nr:hypothetical protein Trco_008007 [Trichoderma cornu-damae]